LEYAGIGQNTTRVPKPVCEEFSPDRHNDVTTITIICIIIIEYKCMFLSRHQNAGQDPGINVANKSFENMSQFK
jgi:hypothetical protein